MANKNMRTVKIYGMSGYKYQATPTIMLKGKWLEELGFEIGDYISVSCEDGKIIITPDAERAALAKTEQEFMDREMANLTKRFQKEKERLHAQFVAERSAEYSAATVTTYNLAYSLQKLGKKVLAVDFDSQANLSTCFGIEDTAAVPVTIGHLMMAQIEDEELPDQEEYIQHRNGVDFISSSMVLSAVDAKLRLEMGAEKMLSGILEPLRDKYDYILLDTSPSVGALNINAMAAADEVVITVNPQLLAMMGMQDFLKMVKKIKHRVNPKLTVAGILLTMCDSRTNLCKVITEQVTDTFEGQIRIFESFIPNTVKVGESVYYSEPLREYAPESKACIAYENFAKEMITYEG